MRKFVVLSAAVLAFALAATATDWPRSEVFLGYNFVRFNPNSDFIPSFNANGGGGQYFYNFNRWFGLGTDIGAVTNGSINQRSVDTTVLNFVAGPRFTFHRHGRFTPFAQVMFGGAYMTSSTQLVAATIPRGVVLPAGPGITARLNVANSGFSMLVGGGLDIKVSKHIAFRPIGVDYMMLRMPSPVIGNDRNTNNFRYSTGFNFMFGAR